MLIKEKMLEKIQGLKHQFHFGFQRSIYYMGDNLNVLLRSLEREMLYRHFLRLDSVFEVDKLLIVLWINKLRHRSSCSWLKSHNIKQSLLKKKNIKYFTLKLLLMKIKYLIIIK